MSFPRRFNNEDIKCSNCGHSFSRNNDYVCPDCKYDNISDLPDGEGEEEDSLGDIDEDKDEDEEYENKLIENEYEDLDDIDTTEESEEDEVNNMIERAEENPDTDNLPL